MVADFRDLYQQACLIYCAQTGGTCMIDKLRTTFHHLAETVEVFMTLFVFAAIVIGIIGLVPVIRDFWFHRSDPEAMMGVLDSILTIVVVAELISLLCSPSAENVTEVLIFLIARHMTVKEMTALEGVLMVISIVMLFLLRRYLQTPERRKTEAGE